MSGLCDYGKLCLKFTCFEPGTAFNGVGECHTAVESNGPHTLSHRIRSNYAIQLCGVSIPIIDTTRDFNTIEYWRYAVPNSVDGVYMASGGTLWSVCSGYTSHQYDFRITEDCNITWSTLHYVDMRYKMVLYRKNIEKVVFDLSSSDTNTFRDEWGYIYVPSLKLYGGNSKNWDSLCTEEWHLVIDGVDTILSSAPYDPLPSMSDFSTNIASINCYKPGYIPDLELILSTSPPQDGDTIGYDQELSCYGCYSYIGGYSSPNYGPDGRGSYFYPAWCRALHQDPFWEDVRKQRELRILDNRSGTYTPPEITVDPMPVGSFVRHPKLGTFWQFILGKHGPPTIKGSPDLDDLVKASLSANNVNTDGSGPMLYYPIGV